MNVLVIAAHPDDEVLGCGGTVARLASEGHTVNIAILGEGITSRYDSRDFAANDKLDHLLSCSETAAAILGATDTVNYELPDNRFDSVALLDIVKIIESLVNQYRPQMVFTQHGGDLNIDHSIVFRATLTAVRPMLGNTIISLYCYEVPSSTEWSFQQFAPVFKPNLFVDISQTIDRKIEAMQAYENEIRDFPHPRSEKNLRAIATHWGSVVGLEAAEAFEIIWDIKGVL